MVFSAAALFWATVGCADTLAIDTAGDPVDPDTGTQDTPSETQDGDGDGWLEPEDCDDQDESISPDAAELCDGVDNDCDGIVDEDSATDATVWYRDEEEDGYGSELETTASCQVPTGYVDNADDCDDSDPRINPEIGEFCGDGRDNDCDTFIDDLDSDCEPDTEPEPKVSDRLSCGDGLRPWPVGGSLRPRLSPVF